jgi:type II secretory pathway component PulM
MAGKRIRNYFMRQARILVERSSRDTEGFAAYFSDREPRDEEILGLIAVTVLLSGKYRLADRYPTPAEALAALSADERSEICREFRLHLQACQRQRLLV